MRVSSPIDHQELKVGFFALAILFVSLFLIFYVAIKKELFSEKVSFFLMSNTGENIELGIPVKLSGIKIGQVSEIRLERNGNAKVMIEIVENYREWITMGTQTMLAQEGVIGGTYIKLVPGPRTNELLLENSKIPLQRVGGIEEKLREILKEAEPVIEDLKVTVANVRLITDQFVEPQGSIQRLLLNADKVSSMLSSREGLLNYVTQDKQAVEKIENILARSDRIALSLDDFLNKLHSKTDELAPVFQKEIMAILSEGKELLQEFKEVRSQLDPAIANIEQITKNIKDATHELDKIRQEGEYTLRLSSELLQQLKNTWPLKERNDSPSSNEHPSH